MQISSLKFFLNSTMNRDLANFFHTILGGSEPPPHIYKWLPWKYFAFWLHILSNYSMEIILWTRISSLFRPCMRIPYTILSLGTASSIFLYKDISCGSSMINDKNTKNSGKNDIISSTILYQSISFISSNCSPLTDWHKSAFFYSYALQFG